MNSSVNSSIGTNSTNWLTTNTSESAASITTSTSSIWTLTTTTFLPDATSASVSNTTTATYDNLSSASSSVSLDSSASIYSPSTMSVSSETSSTVQSSQTPSTLSQFSKHGVNLHQHPGILVGILAVVGAVVVGLSAILCGFRRRAKAKALQPANPERSSMDFDNFIHDDGDKYNANFVFIPSENECHEKEKMPEDNNYLFVKEADSGNRRYSRQSALTVYSNNSGTEEEYFEHERRAPSLDFGFGHRNF